VLLTSCPWDGFRDSTISFCEETVCGLVRSPANAWSNVAYGAVAVWLLVATRRQGTSPFAWVAGAVGLCSFLFHASATFLFQLFDYASMFLFTGLLIVLNVERLRPLWRRHRAPGCAAIVAISSAPLALGGQSGRVVFALHVALVIATEWRCARRAAGAIDHRPYALMLAMFAVAYVFWAIDALRVECHPGDHLFQGHAIWHVLSAACFLAAHWFYAQFPSFARPARAGASAGDLCQSNLAPAGEQRQ